MAVLTIPKLQKMAREGKKMVMITAYDFPSARIADQAGVDIILVGDSLGNAVQGAPNTLPVTLEESLYHAKIVARGCTERTLVVGDMPFGTYQESREQAIHNAVRYIKEAGVASVKLEGGALVQDKIRAMVDAQIPVMAHIGLTPQSLHVFGGHKVQRMEEKLLEDGKCVQDAGAWSVVLEGIPGEIAGKITESLEIPTIGIGAGANCSGQVLVWHDILGLNPDETRTIFIDKGLDVLLVTWMMILLRNQAFDTAILLSGDGDFAEAVREVKRTGCRVEIVGWRNSVSRELDDLSSRRPVLFLDDIRDEIEKDEEHQL